MTKIQEKRLERNLTRAELAQKSKVALSKIYLYESGKGNPTEKTLKKIAPVLGCEARDLL